MKIVEYLSENAYWIFSGIGVAGITILIRFLLKREPSQNQEISRHSLGIQTGRDVSVVDTRKKNEQ